MNANLTLKLGIEFDRLAKAWQYWINYGGRRGFGVRKHYFGKSKKDGSIMSYRYVCCKEGVQKLDKRDFKTINPWSKTRIGCKARMTVTWVNGKYWVSDFIEDHNHPLHPPEMVHMLASQWRLIEVQAYELEVVEDAGIQQKTSFNLMSRYAGGRENLGYTR